MQPPAPTAGAVLGDYGLEDTKTWGLAQVGLRLPEGAGLVFPSTERLAAGTSGT